MRHQQPQTVRQQFPLTENAEEELRILAEALNKKPNDLKKEILTAFANVPARSYYIALGEVQAIGEGVAFKKR